jgi:hypothetical protein
MKAIVRAKGAKTEPKVQLCEPGVMCKDSGVMSEYLLELEAIWT